MATPNPPEEGSVVEEEYSDEDENDIVPDGEGSYYSDERSFRSGEGSRSQGDGSRGERSYHSGEGSYRSGEGSYRSGEGSYRSGEGSYRSGEGSYRSGEGSYRSGEGSYRSGEGSERSGKRSYRSGEGSYRSGEGSYRSGEGSYRSGEGSYRSGEGSHRSGEGSYRSGEGSYRSGQGSYRSGEGSYRSGEGSYRSGEGSHRSGEGSYRSGEGSYSSGQGSYRSGEGSYRSGGSRSFADEEEKKSFRSDEGSYRSGESFHSSQEGSFRDDDRPGQPGGQPSPRNDKGDEQSVYSDEKRSLRDGEGSYDSRQEGSYYSSGGDGQSFGEEEGDYEGRVNGAANGPQSPSRSINFQSSKGSLASGSELGSEAPSFAEELDFSPYAKSPQKSVDTPPVVFENGGFADEDFGKSDHTHNDNKDEPTSLSPGGFSGENDEKVREEGDETTFDDFGNDAFDGNAFASSEPDSALANAFGDNTFESADGGGDVFATSAFGVNDGADLFSGSGFDATNKEAPAADAFAAGFGEADGEGDGDDKGSQSGSSQGSQSEIPAGESTSSFAQEPGAATEQEVFKSEVNDKDELFGDAFGGSTLDDGFGGDLFGAAPDLEAEASEDNAAFGGGFGDDAFGADFGPAGGDSQRAGDDAAFGTSFDAFSGDAGGAGASVHSSERSKEAENIQGDDAVFGATAFGAFTGNGGDASVHSSQGSEEAENIQADDAAFGVTAFGAFSADAGDAADASVHSSQGSEEAENIHAAFGNAAFDTFSGDAGDRGASAHPSDRSEEGENFHADGAAFGDTALAAFTNDAGGISVRSSHRPEETEQVQAKEGSFHSDDGPGDEGSYHSPVGSLEEDSYHSSNNKPIEKGSFHSEHEPKEVSQKLGGSFGSSIGSSVRPPEGSFAEEGSYHSDEHPEDRSFRSEGRPKDSGSHHAGEQSEEKSFHSGDESQGSYRSGQQSDAKSYHSEDRSQGSYRSGEQLDGKSFRSEDKFQDSDRSGDQSDERSFRSGEGSQRLEEGSHKSGDQSYYSDERSARSGERSYRSDEKSFGSEADSRAREEDASLEEGSRRSDEKSFGEEESYRSGSVRSGDASYKSGEGSHRSGEASMKEGSQRSDEKSFGEEESYRSGSVRSGDASYKSGEGSHRSGEASMKEGSQRSDEKSFGEEESYRSGEGSVRSGDESYKSGEASLKEGSQRSDEKSFGEEESYRSREGSVRSADASYKSGEGSHRSGEASMKEGSQRSDEKSFGEEESYRSGEGSVRSGDESYKSGEASLKEGSQRSDEKSFGEEESYRSGEGSVRSGDASYKSGEGSRRSGENEKSFQSESQQSSAQSFAEEDAEPTDRDIDSAHMPSTAVAHVEKPADEQDPSLRDDASQSEESMGIGDVFGQPNELFEHPEAKEENAREDSRKSEMSQDDTIGEGSKEVHKSPGKDRDGSKSASSPSASGKGSDSLQETAVPPEEKVKPKAVHKPKQKLDPEEKRRRKKKKKKLQKEAKSRALLDLVANVNDAMLDLEEREAEEGKENNTDTSAHRLLHGFDALLGIFLQLSDELELISTFAKSKKKKERDAMVPVRALKAVLSFASTLDELFADLKPIILDCFEQEPDEEMDDMLSRLNSLVDLLCETTHRVGEKQEWNERAETTYVTLLELMEREATELISYYEDVDTPEQGLSANIHEAWSATGHIEELRALQYAETPEHFRQLCYEVMVSTDQWCPDTTILMDICDIDESMLAEEPDSEYLREEVLAAIPETAEHVLDKVNGEPLPRTTTLASILRRILPPRAITDATLLDNFTSIRNTLQNPLGLSATNIVSISSVPEQLNDPDSLGVGGIGKTTLAAMVAAHPDVRRYFCDGVVWVYVGDKKLSYNRYTQCLRVLVDQLGRKEDGNDEDVGMPAFPELLNVPGETLSKRRRREEGFMIYARDTIAELLHDRSVLIILDDVCFEPDLDWFDFAPMPGEETDEFDSNCALLVTTRCRTLLPAADTVEVDMLDEADAISLLIQESGQLSHTLMAESREARSVVRECANHPLAVKSVGRWLNLKHATAGVVSSVEEIHSEVIKSMDKILKGGDHTGTDMMYEILSMSLSPAINGEPTSIIKFCLAAFIVVFCDREYISDFALTEPSPIIPMDMAELLFETLLEMNESSLLQKGSLFYAQKKEAAVLIPEALSALGVLKVITYSDGDEEENPEDEAKHLQVMHFIHHEYGEYLCAEEEALKDLTKDAERQWNRAFVEAYLSQVEEWDMYLEDAGHKYALEMIISHMIRGGMFSAAADLLADKSFVRGRLLTGLGHGRHIQDCEMLFKKLKERRPKGSKLEPRNVLKQAYQALGSQLALEEFDQGIRDPRIKDFEVARAHYEIGFSLAERRCWDAAIAHWETSQEILISALGTVEIVAGILFNIGVVYSEMNEYEQALDSLKQCLRIRGTIHGEEHILYAQTIQKIGDIFLGMSDYHEAMESYNWALDVMYTDPGLHRVEIGEILDNKGTIHYSKGEIEEALQCHQEALRSKQVDLGEDHPELAATYHHIGNCLSDQGNVDDAMVHFEEAIRLMELDPEGGPERDAEVLTIEGILHNLEGNQEQGLECYEKSLQILVTKVPHRKEKVASLLHLIGCVYLMSGEQKKAMKLFEESLQARRKVLGFVHLDVASTLFNMAFLHQTRNRLDRALKCLEEALKIRQLRLPDSEKVAVTHEKIGSLARLIGKTKKAQINFEDALRIRRLLHGEQHEAVATVLQELGDLMDDLGEYDSAMSYYIDALDIRRKQLGLDDVAVAETLYSMGYTLHNNDEPKRALVCFEESLNIRRYQLGEDSKEVGDTLNMMGFLKAKGGELDDALTLLWDALRIRKLQEDHVKVSETLKNIGNVHREKQEQELAVECYEECLRIRRTELGQDHEKVADALIAMGNVQSDMERTDEAMRSYQEALKIRTMVFGEHDESVAAVLQYMGTMEFKSGNHEKARDLLTEFIRIRRNNGTKNDGDYVNVLFMIGNIHKMQGHEEDAQLCWSEAYQVFQELGLAETNPQIAKVMNHLLAVEEENHDAEQKKKNKGAGVFGKMTEKLKGNTKEEKLPGKKRRKGKGIQL